MRKGHRILQTVGVLLVVSTLGGPVFGQGNVSSQTLTIDPNGILSTYNTNGAIDTRNAFFQSLGTNGRTCNSCHVAGDAWSIAPLSLRVRFLLTAGTDPVFRPVDGANCPSARVATIGDRQSSYSMLLNKGLIRISLPMPSAADFAITNIQDPYNCAETTQIQPAFYRRPLPATNLPFLTTVMWDGRESPKGRSLTANLTQQAIDATTGHAQGVPPSTQQLQQIVNFETGLYTAQLYDFAAGNLTSYGASGGGQNLSTQKFYVGINDVLGADPTGAAFNPVAFTTFASWSNLTGPSATASRQSIARGEALFNTLPITITGVAGLNDLPGLQTVTGTCTTCHDTPNVGNHSLALAINIGVTDYPGRQGLDISGLPVYTVQCADGNTVQTTDLGRAMVSGKCADVGKTKGPILRALAARAPYFHNGSAATLLDVVNFYEQRFNLSLSDQQKTDLVAFLQSL